jgi:hypothetical protein
VATNRLLFIPQVVYEHGELWWNDISRANFLFVHKSPSGCPSSSHLVAKQEKLAKEIINFSL